MPRDTVRSCGKKWRDARKSHPEQASSSVPKSERTDWRGKLKQSSGRVLQREFKIPCPWKARWKRSSCIYRHHPVCRGYKCGIRYILWHSLPISTCWWWEVTSARGRVKKILKEQLLFWGKKGPRLCISKTQIQWILFHGKLANEIERSGGTHHEILGMHLVRNENSEKKRAKSGGIIQKGDPHERNPCAPVFEEQTLEETLRQANSDSTVAWNGRDKCTMMSKRDISSDWRGYLEKVQRSCDSTDREWESTNKRGRTSFCSWFRSVRDSDDDSMKRQRFF